MIRIVRIKLSMSMWLCDIKKKWYFQLCQESGPTRKPALASPHINNSVPRLELNLNRAPWFTADSMSGRWGGGRGAVRGGAGGRIKMGLQRHLARKQRLPQKVWGTSDKIETPA